MAKRTSNTAAQQCRYYEVDNIFEYMVETYINGNHSTFSELYHELNKETRQDFVEFLFGRGKSAVPQRDYQANVITPIN